MESKKIQVSQLMIHFKERKGMSGTNTIVFIHGNSNSHEIFQKQFSSPFFKNNRLVALDLPGHGKSQKDFAAKGDCGIYSLPYYAKMVSEFLMNLDIQNPILVGHSLGGHLAVQLSRYIKPQGLVLIQSPPLEDYEDVGRAFRMIPVLPYLFTENLQEKEIVELLEAFFPETLPPAFLKKSILETDPLCRKNVGESLRPATSLGEVSLLKQLDCPWAFFHAPNDPLINGDYLRELFGRERWEDRLTLFESAGHYPQWGEDEKFNREMVQFLGHLH